jgi:quinoprotein glucose dehydrogenase
MGKTGFCYVFDRVTGEPVWPIPEVPVPQSTIPGEKTSPTQPMPTKPPPFSTQGVTEETLMDLTPELRQEALEIVSEYGFSPLFNPPNEKGVFMTPGDGGGANWSGAALDPETSIIYVSSISYTRLMGLTKPDPNRSNMRYVVAPDVLKGLSGLPLLKPPYSRITAIDLKTGTHAWMKPMGDGPRDHPKLKGLDLPPMGGGGRAFPLATKTLLIVGHDTRLLALDKATGRTIGELDLRDAEGRALGRVTGAPMTYMHRGRQYIAMPVSQKGSAQQIVALALP